MKIVKFRVNSEPNKPPLGYHDYVEVYDKTKYLFGSHASTCPNPYKSTNDGRSAIPWRLLYGWIADGEYKFQCVMHPKYGKCLLINNGGRVASRTPNPRHNGELYLEEVFCHEGNIGYENPEWRGSIGCPTLHRDYFPQFIACFEVGEKGKLIVEPFITSRKS